MIEPMVMELGAVYTTLSGGRFKILELRPNSHTQGVVGAKCSDGWWRYADGPLSGFFIGKENDPRYCHHTDWDKISPKCRVAIQLELF